MPSSFVDQQIYCWPARAKATCDPGKKRQFKEWLAGHFCATPANSAPSRRCSPINNKIHDHRARCSPRMKRGTSSYHLRIGLIFLLMPRSRSKLAFAHDPRLAVRNNENISLRRRFFREARKLGTSVRRESCSVIPRLGTAFFG